MPESVAAKKVRNCLGAVCSTAFSKAKAAPSLRSFKALPVEPRGVAGYQQVGGQFQVDAWRNAWIKEGVDILCEVGDVIVLNNSNIHAGTVRTTDQHRVDFRIDYGLKGMSLRPLRDESTPDRLLRAKRESDPRCCNHPQQDFPFPPTPFSSA